MKKEKKYPNYLFLWFYYISIFIFVLLLYFLSILAISLFSSLIVIDFIEKLLINLKVNWTFETYMYIVSAITAFIFNLFLITFRISKVFKFINKIWISKNNFILFDVHFKLYEKEKELINKAKQFNSFNKNKLEEKILNIDNKIEVYLNKRLQIENKNIIKN
ncbi:hypothetical protein SLITO_v1c06350 [Spiroplasma litorale]|uniref:Uncharacterized protein n=1 Tax=Spiroplasma litorale TaxID=216942 RepID=A0A0K1W1T2_9MOLU|nr:hypothetical protein [Spiroplasma litorale]AKX34264.1 hypothetical protein SLITO_v1c06350 [Spiroplasma litorale]